MPGDTYYVLTGVDRRGKRFRKTSDNLDYLASHNVWRGNLWQVSRATGKRKHLKTWSN